MKRGVVVAICLALALVLPVVAQATPPIPPLMDSAWPFCMYISRTLLRVGDSFSLTVESHPISRVECHLTIPAGLTIDQFPELGDKGGDVTLIFPYDGKIVLTGKVVRPGERDIWAVFEWANGTTNLHLTVISSKK